MSRMPPTASGYNAKTRDPIMEEVQNSEFSLKIMISAGSISVFQVRAGRAAATRSGWSAQGRAAARSDRAGPRACGAQVGGLIDEVTDPTTPEIPHWEFFIGDRPLAPRRDQFGRRRCIAQLAAIEDHAEAGEVVGSKEVRSEHARAVTFGLSRRRATHPPPCTRNDRVQVIDLIEDEWDIEVVQEEGEEDVGKVRGPARPFAVPQRQQHTTVRLRKAADKLLSGSRKSAAGSLDPSVRKPSTADADSAGLGKHGTSHAGTGNDTPPRRKSLVSGAETPTKRKSQAGHTESPFAAVADDAPSGDATGRLAGAASVSGAAAGGGDDEHALAEFSDLSDQMQRRLAGVLRMHVLGSVRSRIEAGHLDFINEIRPLTCLFLGFPSLLQENFTASHEEQVSDVQYCIHKVSRLWGLVAVAAAARRHSGRTRATRRFTAPNHPERRDVRTQVQEVMRKWDGSLMQFRCDEKGFVAICAFGLPGHTHEDNPTRGILAALDLHERIEQRGHRVCVGVTTGDLLCTCVGARKMRSEYTVFGDAINLSARLMVKCKKGAELAAASRGRGCVIPALVPTCGLWAPCCMRTRSGSTGDILCDEPTHAHAKLKASFEELEPLTVKGKKLPVSA